MIGARDFALQIYDLALLRALVGVGRDLVEGALDSEDVAPLAQIERAETELYKVAEAGGAEGKAKSFAEATKEALEMAERALNSGGHLSGFTTGLDSLNSKIGGLHKSDLIIVAGRPGMGKSALGTNMAFAAARRFLRDLEEGIEPAKSAGAPAALFSLEMSADQLATRILSEQSDHVRKPAHGPHHAAGVPGARAGGGGLQSLPLYIDDTPGLDNRCAPDAHAVSNARRTSASSSSTISSCSKAAAEAAVRTASKKSPRSAAVSSSSPRSSTFRHRALAAQPCGRAARRQEAATVRPS